MLQRPYIHPDSLLLEPLKGASGKSDFDPNDAIRCYEIECERRFITTLDRVGIVATVKSDRYSLPYRQEIKVVRRFSEYINSAYWQKDLHREILGTLIAEDISKLRFYFFIRVFDKRRLRDSYVEYSFRYTAHRKFNSE